MRRLPTKLLLCLPLFVLLLHSQASGQRLLQRHSNRSHHVSHKKVTPSTRPRPVDTQDNSTLKKPWRVKPHYDEVKRGEAATDLADCSKATTFAIVFAIICCLGAVAILFLIFLLLKLQEHLKQYQATGMIVVKGESKEGRKRTTSWKARTKKYRPKSDQRLAKTDESKESRSKTKDGATKKTPKKTKQFRGEAARKGKKTPHLSEDSTTVEPTDSLSKESRIRPSLKNAKKDNSSFAVISIGKSVNADKVSSLPQKGVQSRLQLIGSKAKKSPATGKSIMAVKSNISLGEFGSETCRSLSTDSAALPVNQASELPVAAPPKENK